MVNQDIVFKTLLQQRGTLIGYIYSIIRDSHLAEDIFQDVSLIVLKKYEQLEDMKYFSGWVRKIARFEALNKVRKEAKLVTMLEEELMDKLDKAWSYQDDESEEEIIEHLQDCVSGLTERSQNIINLRYNESLSGQSLADRLGFKLNNLYVSLTRIHKAIEKCIRKKCNIKGSK